MKKILSFFLLIAIFVSFGMPKAAAASDTLALFDQSFMLNYGQHTVPFSSLLKPVLVLEDTVLTEESFQVIQYKINGTGDWINANAPQNIPYSGGHATISWQVKYNDHWYFSNAGRTQKITMTLPPCNETEITADKRTDYDGNVYEVAGAGGNCWINSNIRAEHYSVNTTHFSAGDPVQGKMIYNAEMNSDTLANLAKYSYLYTWYGAMGLNEDAADNTPITNNDEWGHTVGVCPDGWYLPTAADYRALMAENANNLRSGSNWLTNPGTNSTGMSLEPGGCYSDGANRFMDLLSTAYFWSCEPVSAGSPIVRCWMADCFCYMIQEVTFPKSSALSVRCVKEQIKKAPEFQDLDLFAIAPSTSIWAIASFASLGCEISNYQYCIAEDNGMTANKVCNNSQNLYYEFKNLTRGKTYYVQVTATNELGNDVSTVKSIMVPPIAPEVTTDGYANVTHNSAKVAGTVTYDGGAQVTKRGICYGVSANPTVKGSLVKLADTQGEGSFTCDLTSLISGKTYHVRAFAINSVDTSYGEDKSFTTLALDTVTFMKNGGFGTMERQVFLRGIAENLTTNAFKHDKTVAPDTNWVFMGWNTEADGTGDSYADEFNYTSVANDTLYAQWKTWCTGTPKANETGSGRIESITDGTNAYEVVQIGNQCWMKQNLRTTQYANGNNIGEGTTGETSTTTGYRYANTDEDANFVDNYGYLYNWAAVDSSAGLCPTGWHVPSDAEWTTLTDYVGTNYDCGGNSSNTGKALASTEGWNSSTTTCAVGNTPSDNNATGFSAVPAGNYIGSYNDFVYYAFFWSATQVSSTNAYSRNLYYNITNVYRANAKKGYGRSVRCVRTTESVTVSFDANGGSGTMTDQEIDGTANLNANTTITAPAGYVFNGWNTASDYSGDHYFDGEEITPTSDMTLYAEWFKCGDASSKAYDIDKNAYATLQLGSQCWFKENLKTTHYANGDNVSMGTTGETSTTTGYRYANTDEDANFVDNYGYLYNWAAVDSSAGLCPTGWHVPSDAEWATLTSYVKLQSEYVSEGCAGTDDNTNTYCIAKALASTTGWNSSSTDYTPGKNPSDNNATGFSAVPTGGYDGSYGTFGHTAYFWSATQSSSTLAYGRHLDYYYTYVSRTSTNKYYGRSVRCLCD